MEKLKICHVSLAVYPDHRDGSAKFERNIYEELKARGHDIILLTVQWAEGFQDSNIHTIDVPNSRFLWVPKYSWTYRNYLKSNEFDILHANGSRGALPIILAKKKYVTHIHDVGPFQTSFSAIPGLKWLERKNARKATKIMCGAQSVRTEISEYMNVDKNKITVVSVGIDPQFKPEPKKGEILKEKLRLKGPVMFYVGRIAFYKGVDDIIKAYHIARKEIPDLSCVIGGKPTIKMEPIVEKWKDENPGVQFVGIIPDEDLPTYYSMADMFVTYSYASEGFGITPVESLSCGTPVICSDLPAYKEVLKNQATFVQPRNPSLLAEQIVKHVKIPEMGIDKVKSAAPLLQNYSWKEVVNRIESVYSEYLYGEI
ncbi:MAG: glycosyltransferase family 4 protein [Candidatus Lokiarchaeota archaeon]|nr:glycosyltransferase family 4 protein [Candidatus Lokiarchaeota archaeon]